MRPSVLALGNPRLYGLLKHPLLTPHHLGGVQIHPYLTPFALNRARISTIITHLRILHNITAGQEKFPKGKEEAADAPRNGGASAWKERLLGFRA